MGQRNEQTEVVRLKIKDCQLEHVLRSKAKCEVKMMVGGSWMELAASENSQRALKVTAKQPPPDYIKMGDKWALLRTKRPSALQNAKTSGRDRFAKCTSAR